VSTALVTGAAGFIGRHLLRRLTGAGFHVKVLARDAARLDAATLRCEALPAELTLTSETARWQAALAGVAVCYHLAGIAHRAASREQLRSVNEEATLRLAGAAAQASVDQFVMLSSVKVLGDVSDAPLAETAAYAPADAYGESKMRAEQRLLSLGLGARLSIVRPPLVYGPGVKANFLALLKLADLAGRGLPLPLGAARAPRSFLGAANLCDFLLELAGRDDAGGILHVADAQNLCVAEILELLNDGRRLRLWRVPAEIMSSLLRAAGRGAVYQRLFEPLELDSAATRARLGWAPPFTGGELLRETMAWYRQR
jgi:UDP-glucose 4-epimerase